MQWQKISRVIFRRQRGRRHSTSALRISKDSLAAAYRETVSWTSLESFSVRVALFLLLLGGSPNGQEISDIPSIPFLHLSDQKWSSFFHAGPPVPIPSKIWNHAVFMRKSFPCRYFLQEKHCAEGVEMYQGESFDLSSVTPRHRGSRIHVLRCLLCSLTRENGCTMQISDLGC